MDDFNQQKPTTTTKATKPKADEEKPLDVTERRKELEDQAQANQEFNDEQVNTQAQEIADAEAKQEEVTPPTDDELRQQAQEQADAEASLTSPEAIKKFEEANKKAMAEARKK